MAKKNIGVSAGIIPWFKSNEGRFYFLMGHPSNKPTNYWLYMRGMVEDWEKLEETAIREFREESGIDVSAERNKLQYLGIIKQREGKSVAAYSLSIKDIDNTHVSLLPGCTDGMHSNMCCGGTVPEIDDYQWMSFEDVIRYTHETNIPFFTTIVRQN